MPVESPKPARYDAKRAEEAGRAGRIANGLHLERRKRKS
jgi:hypothetical protein